MTQFNDIPAMLDGMAAQLGGLFEQRHISNPCMVGIHTGGVWVAEQLHRRLAISEPLGSLDISFYRDDFTRIGMNPVVQPSKLPFSLDNRHIILVDDVLHTGRTIRAALNELFDYGRPASIMLAALIERSGRELPIAADVVGAHVELSKGEHIKLTGPDPLRLETRHST
jgi:pyrimidine operon attenuation protein/uracil phosphoribosyltransferase